jgi:hypothetical protein
VAHEPGKMAMARGCRRRRTRIFRLFRPGLPLRPGHSPSGLGRSILPRGGRDTDGADRGPGGASPAVGCFRAARRTPAGPGHAAGSWVMPRSLFSEKIP